MRKIILAGIIFGLAAGAWWGTSQPAPLPGPAMAGPRNYMFELAELEVPTGNATLTVRLIQMSSGRAVSDAVIVANTVEMIMPGRTPIAAAVTPARADGQGSYRFDAQLPMPGDWVVHLAARVRGEPEIIRGDVKVMAMP